MDSFIFASEAARILELSRNRVYDLAEAGDLSVVRTQNGTRLFKLSEVRALADRRKRDKNTQAVGV